MSRRMPAFSPIGPKTEFLKPEEEYAVESTEQILLELLAFSKNGEIPFHRLHG